MSRSAFVEAKATHFLVSIHTTPVNLSQVQQRRIVKVRKRERVGKGRRGKRGKRDIQRDTERDREREREEREK